MLVVLVVNVMRWPFWYPANDQLGKVNLVVDKIVAESGGEEFNFGLISKGNYDEGYRFVMERRGTKLVAIDPQLEETVTEQLFVICEEEECNPVGHGQSEIAAFGWSQIADEWEMEWGHRLYKLERFEEEE